MVPRINAPLEGSVFILLEIETSYETLKQELFALRFLQCMSKDEEELNKINEQIKNTKNKILKEMLEERKIENDKHKRK